jgi:hypothetical protein
MKNFNVDSKHTDALAAQQDKAAAEAVKGAKATDKVKAALWVTHGVISFESNLAAEGMNSRRRAAAAAVGNVATELARRLRTAGITYSAVDEELRQNLDNQMLR